MANVILPRVGFIFACQEAALDLTDLHWLIKRPLTVNFLPAGQVFPFRAADLSVYAHLAGGLGTIELAVEMRQKLDDGSFRSVGTGAVLEVQFPAEQSRLAVLETVFGFKGVPFRSEGIYEFRVIAKTAEGYQALNGQTAEITVLASDGRL